MGTLLNIQLLLADQSFLRREKAAVYRMRPKIKGDTFYIPIAEGIYFRNNQGSFILKGKIVYRWFERLVPYLQGEYTLEEISDGLPAEKQTMISNLVHTLLERGFLKDVTFDLPHTLNETEQRLYASEIAFIDAFTDSATHRFEQFRNSRLLVIGSGLTLTGLIHSLLSSGLRQVAFLATPEGVLHQQRHAEYLALYNGRGADQALVQLPPLEWSDTAAVAAALAPFDVVISISDVPMLARAHLLNRLCRERQKTLLQAVLVADYAWVGPFVSATTPGCWECAWRRLQANLPDLARAQHTFQDHCTTPPSRFLALPTASLVANQLSFEVFKHLTGIDRLETDGCLFAIDLETAQTEKHPFLPHPLCETCQSPPDTTDASFQDRLRILAEKEPLDEESFSKQATICFESRLGLFSSLDEHDFAQLPLHIAQVVISNPLPQRQCSAPWRATGVGLDFATARRRATRRACELYAASFVDPRQFLHPAGEHRACSVHHAQWLFATEHGVTGEACVRAQELGAGKIHVLPADLVYPIRRGLTPSEQSMPGLASGFSWAEAVSLALISCYRFWAMTHLEDLQEPAPLVDMSLPPYDSAGARYRCMLDLFGKTLSIYDLSALLGIPMFAFCWENETLAYSAHLDVQRALEAGFEQAVQYMQAMTHRQPHCAPPVVPGLPRRLRGTRVGGPVSNVPADWPSRQAALQQLLQARGWRAFVVPLQPDPALAALLPCIVHVLLAHRS